MASKGKPGRPGLSFEDVSSAATEILASGGRPSAKTVRDRLGGGSLTSIQRHLDDWRNRRAHAHARTPLGVTGRDIEALEPADFATLINHLIRLEIRKNGIAANPDTTLRLNDADGGIDGLIAWTGGPTRTARLPSRLVAWQAKSGRRLSASELIREIQQRSRADLKPGIRKALTDGGAYVVFTAADMTADQKMTRVNAMIEVARQHLVGVEPRIVILAGDDIAAWAAEDLWARTFVIRAAGRDHPTLLRTFDEWRAQPEFENQYVWTAATSGVAARIRDSLEHCGTAFRIDGPPGLGKTRLALESLRPLARDHGIVYFDARYSGTQVDLLRALPNWKRLGIGGIIVVDDCDLALHQQIVAAIIGSQMNAVTIDWRRESGANVSLTAVPDETIESILRANHRAKQMRLEHAEIMRIVEYAQGWPLMAILVLAAISNNKPHIADLDDDQLTRRLIGYDDDSDERRVLRILAMFDHVGFRDEVKDQWEVVRSRFTADISPDSFYRIVRSFERTGLIVTIGRYWRVTPPPLAIRLTREWLDEARPEIRDELFGKLPAALSRSLARRFDDIGTPTAVELAETLLRPGARFGNLEGVLGKTNAHMVRALAQVNPAAALTTLSRVLLPLSDEDLREIDDNLGRQTLVSALEGIAFHRAHFLRAALVLFALARNENAAHGSSSTETLVKLFGVLGSQTEAVPDDRIHLLDEMLRFRDEAAEELAAKALQRILSSDAPFVVVGVESQGGRRPLEEWRPTTWGDIFDYYRKAIDRVLILAERGQHGFELARTVIADSVLTLVRYQRWEDIERAFAPLIGAAWPRAVDRLSWTIRYELRGDDKKADRKRAETLLKQLVPTNLEEQIKLFITEAPSDLEERDRDIVDVSLEKLEHFVKETIASGDVRNVLGAISTGQHHRLDFAYGHAVANWSPDLEQLANDALDAFASAAEPRRDIALMGIISVIGQRDATLRQKLLDRIEQDERLIAALPAVSAVPSAETRDVERLIRTYASKRLRDQPREHLFLGRLFANVDDAVIRKFVILLIDFGWFASAVALLTFGVTSNERFDDLLSHLILASNFIFKPMRDVHEWSLFEIAKRLAVSGDAAFRLNLASQMMDLAVAADASYHAKRRVADLWPTLLTHDDVWIGLSNRYRDLDARSRFRLLSGVLYIPSGAVEHELAIEVVPLDELMAFATENETDVPWFLARYGKIVDPGHPEQLKVTPLMAALLDRFGERDDVLRNLDANLNSFLSVGPRASYYSQRIALLDQIPTFGRAKLLAWKEELRARLEAERRQAQAHDDEFSEGIF